MGRGVAKRCATIMITEGEREGVRKICYSEGSQAVPARPSSKGLKPVRL